MAHRLRSSLAVDLPQNNLAPSAAGEVGPRTPVPEQGSPTTEPPLQIAQPQNHTASRSSTDMHISENDVSAGDATIEGMQELAAASSALLTVTHDMSTAHKQVRRAQGVTSKVPSTLGSLALMAVVSVKVKTHYSDAVHFHPPLSLVGDGGAFVQRS